MYVDREDDETLVLYIDDLRRSDEGQYSCESDFDGQLATQHAQLIIYGLLTNSLTHSDTTCIHRPKCKKVFALETANVKGKIERKFSVRTEMGHILAVLGVLGLISFAF